MIIIQSLGFSGWSVINLSSRKNVRIKNPFINYIVLYQRTQLTLSKTYYFSSDLSRYSLITINHESQKSDILKSNFTIYWHIYYISSLYHLLKLILICVRFDFWQIIFWIFSTLFRKFETFKNCKRFSAFLSNNYDRNDFLSNSEPLLTVECQLYFEHMFGVLT